MCLSKTHIDVQICEVHTRERTGIPTAQQKQELTICKITLYTVLRAEIKETIQQGKMLSIDTD